MEKSQRIAVRLPPWLLDAVDLEVARRQQRRLGSSINRSDIVREVLARALVKARALGGTPPEDPFASSSDLR